MENEVFFLLPQKRKASQWDAFRFSDNPCFNFAKHKLSSISIMNLFAVIKIDFPQFLQIFLANKHYIIVELFALIPIAVIIIIRTLQRCTKGT